MKTTLLNLNYDLKDFLFLFDIDGTILDSKGCGGKAFFIALEKVLGINNIKKVSFLGGIDNVVFSNVYEDHCLPSDKKESLWKEFQEVYTAELQKLADEKEWHLYPNIDAIIEYLNDSSHLALVTGNIKEGARIKLNKFNLDKYFSCGGYGDTATDRKDFVKDAIERAEDMYGKRFNKDKIYLLGDTEKDVKSAHDNGIIPILIDHHNRFTETHQSINALYYKDYLGFDTFFRSITEIVK